MDERRLGAYPHYQLVSFSNSSESATFETVISSLEAEMTLEKFAELRIFRILLQTATFETVIPAEEAVAKEIAARTIILKSVIPA